MYYYLHDTFLSDKKYEKVLDRIKTALLDLDIQGRHERLNLLKSVEELVTDEIKRGAHTIIVLGNDKTFLKVMEVVARNKVTLGIIPIGPDNALAESLGVPKDELQACETIAARKIVNFDLGRANEQYFFSHLKIIKNLNRLTVHKDKYKITPKQNCSEIDIYNYYYPPKVEDEDPAMRTSGAQDRRLELVIRSLPQKKSWFAKKGERAVIDTVIKGENFKIKSFEYLPVLLDDFKVIKTPVSVDLATEKLKVIVGKLRRENIQ